MNTLIANLITLATAVALLGGPLIVIWREIRKTKAETIAAKLAAAEATAAGVEAAAAGVAAAKAAKVAAKQAGAIHKIVNSQRTEMLAYQDVLTKALTRAGVAVPEDASITQPAPATKEKVSK